MPNKDKVENYDVAVVGGGPAGIIAAIKASEEGSRVILIEKNNSLGKKLLLTGGGRCNITNIGHDLGELIHQYGEGGSFLYSSFSLFGPDALVEYFNEIGLPTKVENNNRVFPVSNKSIDVLNVLIKQLKTNNVEIRLNCLVKKIVKKGNKIASLTTNGGEIKAKKYIISVGGKSYPATGSSGDGYSWLNQLGHKIIDPVPALTPIFIKEKQIVGVAGISLANIEITAWQGAKRLAKESGELLFTHKGLSGPAVLNLSNKISGLLFEKKGELMIKIDLESELNVDQLDKKILELFSLNQNKSIKNVLTYIYPEKLTLLLLSNSKIPNNKAVNVVSKPERMKLLKQIKLLTFTANNVGGFAEAMITGGGVDVQEINPKTMQSKIIENLYLAGEIINVHGPSGGYNLQICWATGYVAGVK